MVEEPVCREGGPAGCVWGVLWAHKGSCTASATDADCTPDQSKLTTHNETMPLSGGTPLWGLCLPGCSVCSGQAGCSQLTDGYMFVRGAVNTLRQGCRDQTLQCKRAKQGPRLQIVQSETRCCSPRQQSRPAESSILQSETAEHQLLRCTCAPQCLYHTGLICSTRS